MDVSQLGQLSASLSHTYMQLAKDAKGAMASTSNAEVGQRVRLSVQDLGNSSIELIKAGGSCQSNPGDIYSQRDVADNAHHVSEKVGRPSRTSPLDMNFKVSQKFRCSFRHLICRCRLCWPPSKRGHGELKLASTPPAPSAESSETWTRRSCLPRQELFTPKTTTNLSRTTGKTF